MKSYTITVNGNVYHVTVEETTADAGSAQQVSAPVPQPTIAQTSPEAIPQPSGSAGKIEVKASVPGKVIGIEVTVGQSVKAGDNVLILESMKMEIPVVAPVDGTIVSILVSEGDNVENGVVLATMN